MLELNKLYLIDAIVGLKQLDDNSIDIIATDPPYGIKYDKWDNNFNKEWFEQWIKEGFRILKPSGSFYGFSNFKVVADLKLIMDKYGQMQNWIIWGYRTGGVSKKRWARKHDDILFYTKTNDYYFNPQKERVYYNGPFFDTKQDEKGRWYADVYLRDIWDDVKAVINTSKDRQFIVSTQKPIILMKRLLKSSCPKDGIVLDPFMGSGTTIVAAKNLGLTFIGFENNKKHFKIAKANIDKIPEYLENLF